MEKKIKSYLIYGSIIGAIVFVLFFLITSSWIGYGVKEQCQKAQEKYQGDCVETLIKVVEDEDVSPDEKNSAVWALGQLQDEKSLPTLEKHYQGEVEKKCNHDEEICQYEIKKAIDLINGFNMTAFVWRWQVK